MTHHPPASHEPSVPHDSEPDPQPASDLAPAHPLRDPETRRRDHEQIDRLADSVLPDLISRLAASGLGEIEVREDDWRIRLRRPAPVRGGPLERGDRGQDRAGDRSLRSGAPASATPEPALPRDPRDLHDQSHSQPVAAPAAHANGAVPGVGDNAGPPAGLHHVTATSPTVGVFQPRTDVRLGSIVRAGDRIAVVDLLGLPQDVVSPEDGVVVDTLVEAGEGVEYGQDLVVIEVVGRHHPGADGGATPPAIRAEA